MRRIIIFLVIAFSVPSALSATRWVSVSKDSERQYYIDLDEVVVDGVMRTIWLKSVLFHPIKKREASRVEKWMHDCENNRVKLLAITVYRADGGVLGSGEAPHYTQGWQNYSHVTRSELAHQKACGYSSKVDDKPVITGTDGETS